MRCEMHPRFSPERDGLGAIRGGCTTCASILGAYQARQNLMRTIKEFELKTAEFETVKPRQKRNATSNEVSVNTNAGGKAGGRTDKQ